MSKKITDYTENTAPAWDDLLEMVDDPAGTPASRKSKIGRILATGMPVERVSSGTPTGLGIPFSPKTGNRTAQNGAQEEHFVYCPFRVLSPIVITNAACYVSGAVASSNVYFGIVAADITDFQPTGNIIGQSSVASATTGQKTVSGLSWALNPGLYLTIIGGDTASWVQLHFGEYPIPDVAVTADSQLNQIDGCWRKNTLAAGGAIPDPPTLPDWDTQHAYATHGFFHAITYDWNAA